MLTWYDLCRAYMFVSANTTLKATNGVTKTADSGIYWCAHSDSNAVNMNSKRSHASPTSEVSHRHACFTSAGQVRWSWKSNKYWNEVLVLDTVTIACRMFIAPLAPCAASCPAPAPVAFASVDASRRSVMLPIQHTTPHTISPLHKRTAQTAQPGRAQGWQLLLLVPSLSSYWPPGHVCTYVSSPLLLLLLRVTRSCVSMATRLDAWLEQATLSPAAGGFPPTGLAACFDRAAPPAPLPSPRLQTPRATWLCAAGGRARRGPRWPQSAAGLT
eukprot:COSAG01_NODE_21739_length_887_cov_1.366751_1_plen_271_part_10